MTSHKKETKFFYLFLLASGVYYLVLSALTRPVGSDPGRLWRFSKIFLDGDISEAFRSMEPFLPVALNATLLGYGGTSYPLIMVQGIASVLLIFLVSNYILKNYGVYPALLTVTN